MKKPAAKTAALKTITLPTLKAKEIYAGVLLVDGQPDHHVILLPGERDSIQWKPALAWAKKQGGDLPTRKEQALLFANAGKEFQSAWYWSSARHASHPGCAWMQGFNNGSQVYNRTGNDYRARAVRRVPIE